MALHKKLNGADVHVSYRWIVANATERAAVAHNPDGSDITENDGLYGKLYQRDTGAEYTCSNHNPIVFTLVSAGSGGAMDAVDVNVETSGFTKLLSSADDRAQKALATLDVHGHPIADVVGLQVELNGKVDDAQVLTNVPTGAVFTDTVYDHTAVDTHLANTSEHFEQSAISITESQISNLKTYIETETITSLSLSTNVLSFTDEAGSVTQLDLSLYLDDTNLAYLVSGSLNGATGIATFARDDTTTFTVDFSALLDDTQVTVIDNLGSTSGSDALSANQGRVLNSLLASKANSSQVLTDVPNGALFTDTTYSVGNGGFGMLILVMPRY